MPAPATAIVASSIANFCKNRMSDHASSHQVIRRPTDQRQQRAGHTNFSECDQHLARFKPARVPAHQRVEQKKIDRRDEARSKTQDRDVPIPVGT